MCMISAFINGLEDISSILCGNDKRLGQEPLECLCSVCFFEPSAFKMFLDNQTGSQ